MPRAPFTENFTQQPPIPQAGIATAIEVMRSGRLHRYNTLPGELSESLAACDVVAGHTCDAVLAPLLENSA